MRTSASLSVCACMRTGRCVCGRCWSVRDDYVLLLKGQIRSHHRTIRGRQYSQEGNTSELHRRRTQTCTRATHRYCTWTCVGPDPCRPSAHTVHSLQNEPSATLHLANDTLYCPITARGINTNQPAGKLKCHIRFSSLAESVFLLSSGQHVRLA